MAGEMTIEKAEEILKDESKFGTEFWEAYSFLLENAPESETLKMYSEEEYKEIERQRAKDFAERSLQEEDINDGLVEARDVLDGDEAGAEIDDELDVYDAENNMTLTDEDAVLRNTQKIDDMMSTIDDRIKFDYDFYDLRLLKNKLEIEVGDGAEAKDAESAESYWDVVVESAKQQAMMLRAGDKKFFMQKDEDKEKALCEDIKNIMAVSLVRGVGGSAMRQPTKEELDPSSNKFATYLKEEAEKAQQAIDHWLYGVDDNDENKRVKLNTNFILDDAVETSSRMNAFANRWKQKGFKKVGKDFARRRKQFDERMKRIWGKTYETRKAAIEHIKNNKWRLIADTAATATVALTASTGLALPVVAGYALYTAAGSWAWPLVEKKTKAIREAYKAGKDAGEWKGFKGIAKAYAEIKADKKSFKSYKNRAVIGTAFGIAGAGVVAGMGAAANWTVDKVGYLTAKVASSVIRSTGSITSQMLNYHDVKKDFKADPSDENRMRLKQAKWGLGIGATIAMAGNLYSFNHLLETNAASDNSAGVWDKVKSWFKPEKPEKVVGLPNDSIPVKVGLPNDSIPVKGGLPNDSIPVKVGLPNDSIPVKGGLPNDSIPGKVGLPNDSIPVKGGLPNDSIPVKGGLPNDDKLSGDNGVPTDANVEEVTAPDAYNRDMGISERHWNEMHKKLTGIYENHSEIFGTENVSSDEAWDNMYQNLENARKADPNMFGDMTNEEVLYKYMKLIENTERVKVGPDGFLVTRLDKDGLPMYNDPQVQKVMRAMTATINCGEKFDVPLKDMNKVLGYIDENSGRYTGPGADIGVTENRYIGGRADCGDKYQNAWKHVAGKVAARQAAAEPEVVTSTPVVPEKPAVVEEVVVNDVPENKAPEISEEVVNENPNTVVINEGATNGNLDVNSEEVKGRSRSFRVRTSEGR